MNWIDAIILLVVVAIIGGIIAFGIVSRKRGDGGCSKCAYARDCARNKKRIEKNLDSKQNTIETHSCPCCQEKTKNNK